MEVRKRWMALGMLAGMAGCQHAAGTKPESTSQVWSSLPEGAVLKKPGDLPKQQPKAGTCVAYGDFRAAEANAPDQDPALQEPMREQARRAYMQALAIDPRNLKAHQGLARLQAAAGDHEQAIATWTQALKYHPKEASLWYDLGMAHSRKKEWDSGLEALGRAAELEPNNRTYVNMHGYALARNGQLEESLACFSRVNGEAKAHYNLARMLNHLGKREESKKHLELALQIDPALEPARQLFTKLAGPPRPESKPVTQTDAPARAEAQQVSYPVVPKPAPTPLPGTPAEFPQFEGVENLASAQPTRGVAADQGAPIVLPRPPMRFSAPGRATAAPINEPNVIVTSVGELKRDDGPR